MVHNPCPDSGMSGSAASVQPVKDYSRQAEEQRSGKFDLEEGLQAAFASFSSSISYSLAELRELNQSAEAVIRANNVRRNPNNIGSSTNPQP